MKECPSLQDRAWPHGPPQKRPSQRYQTSVEQLWNTCGTPVEHLWNTHNQVQTWTFPTHRQRLRQHNSVLTMAWRKPPTWPYETCYKMAYCTCLRSGWSFAINVYLVKGCILKRKVSQSLGMPQTQKSVRSVINFQTQNGLILGLPVENDSGQ